MYTTKETQEKLNISRQTLAKYIRQEKLHPIQKQGNNHNYFDKEEVDNCKPVYSSVYSSVYSTQEKKSTEVFTAVDSTEFPEEYEPDYSMDHCDIEEEISPYRYIPLLDTQEYSEDIYPCYVLITSADQLVKPKPLKRYRTKMDPYERILRQTGTTEELRTYLNT